MTTSRDAIDHLDFTAECEWHAANGCGREASWIAVATCPGCGIGMFVGDEPTRYACQTVRDSYLAGERHPWVHEPCMTVMTLGDVVVWRRIGRAAA